MRAVTSITLILCASCTAFLGHIQGELGMAVWSWPVYGAAIAGTVLAFAIHTAEETPVPVVCCCGAAR